MKEYNLIIDKLTFTTGYNLKLMQGDDCIDNIKTIFYSKAESIEKILKDNKINSNKVKIIDLTK